MDKERAIVLLTLAHTCLGELAKMVYEAENAKPKEKTMATSTPKKTTTKKASKPLAKGLKAVKAMKPAKKVAK